MNTDHLYYRLFPLWLYPRWPWEYQSWSWTADTQGKLRLWFITLLSAASPGVCLVPRLLSAWVKRTHLPVQCCIPLMEINLILVTTSLLPPLQTHFVQVTKALWPPASLKQMVTGTCLSSTAADAWLSHPCSSTGPHTTPQARNTSPSPDFIAGDGAAPTGPEAGWGWGDIFPHWEG